MVKNNTAEAKIVSRYMIFVVVTKSKTERDSERLRERERAHDSSQNERGNKLSKASRKKTLIRMQKNKHKLCMSAIVSIPVLR